MTVSKDLVIPGDFVGYAEEYLSGYGTYDNEGKLYSLITGIVNQNDDEREISIKPIIETPPEIKKDDVVYGRVADLRNNFLVVNLSKVSSSSDREIVRADRGILHISNIKRGYVNQVSDEFNHNDIIKAKVVDKDTVTLSTEDENLGVIIAKCQNCKTRMDVVNGKLHCPQCKRTETKKVSSDYGIGAI